MNYKSHSETEIKEARKNGLEVWELDSRNAGEDDTLIGSKEEVIADICAHLEIERLPKKWGLYEVYPLENLFGRHIGTERIALFWEDGTAVHRVLEWTTVYPVDSRKSCAYEHPKGIIISLEDAEKFNIPIE